MPRLCKYIDFLRCVKLIFHCEWVKINYEKRINEKEWWEGYHSWIFGSKVAVWF